MAGFLLSGDMDSPSNKFDYSAEGLTLRANAEALFNPAQAPVVRVRAPYLENPPIAGFLLFGDTDSPSNKFDYSAEGLTLRANAEALFNPAQAPVVRVRAPYLEEPAYGAMPIS
ncbi:hypothetical protein [Serratia plymuthica]|uniref:hypothetical protein n=1 Tax=Serratia plymuthica TaxID=82996 RepID=UPI000937FD04|nr:hypothetical protein [Serratia plymuthica]OJT41037.1 hypothetical protein BSR04_12395 [Serratia plymuthica]